MRTSHAILLALLTAAATTGCVVDVDPPGPPTAAITCKKPNPQALRSIRRVVFIEIVDEQTDKTGIGEEMTRAVYKALHDRKLFHVYLVDRTDQIYKDLRLDEPRRYTQDELKTIQETLDCDAVLVGKIRNFQVPPRLQLGLYLSLIDVRMGRVVWGVDHYWDSTDQAVEKRLKNFFKYKMRDGYDPANWEIAQMSPKLFSKFVAYEAVGTLIPPRRPRMPARAAR